MKELEKLAEELKKELYKKERELQSKDDCDKYSWGHLENRRRDVIAFTSSINDVAKDPFLKNEIIKNYIADARSLTEKIRQIK